MSPLVSVIIPTFQRPQLVARAVRSALAQTVRDIEVIVVADGPAALLADALAEFTDARLIVHSLAEQSGANVARNAGVARARAEWIAFLDDDDEWMPEKIARQLALAQASRAPILTCQFIARSVEGDMLMPHRVPRPGEPLCEYLYCQTSVWGGEGWVLTSTLFVKKELVIQIPFTPGLRRNMEADWLLHVARVPGIAVAFVFEPLAIWHIEADYPRIGDWQDWEYVIRWAQARRELFTARAFAGFMLTSASLTAARGRDWRAFFLLPLMALRHGRASPVDWLAHLAIWCVPPAWRRQVGVWRNRHGHV
jgi:glycosyltransferase involved in cell wall biosynthesis